MNRHQWSQYHSLFTKKELETCRNDFTIIDSNTIGLSAFPFRMLEERWPSMAGSMKRGSYDNGATAQNWQNIDKHHGTEKI